MKFFKKLKNRYNILVLILAVVFLILSFKLATLTIVEGDYYRDLSDNKGIKEISITAPRGEIRDRYGRLLAGNKPSFTVQIMKDELNIKDKQKKNEVILNLVRLLEQDGVDYVNEFPIELNIFKYKNENDYYTETITPEEVVVDAVLKNNLFSNVLNTYYYVNNQDDKFEFLTANRVLHILENKGIDVPIIAKLENESVKLDFDKNEDIERWKNKNQMPSSITPREALIKIVNNDKSIIRKTIGHPIVRKLTYDILNNKGLVPNINIEPYSLKFDEEFLTQKRTLIKKFSNITMTSKAKDDFVNIALENNILDLMKKVLYEKDKEGKKSNKIIPGKILIDEIEKEGIKCPVTYEANYDNDTVSYKFKDKSISSDKNPLITLIELGKKEKVIDKMITNDKVKTSVQEMILNSGINPKISISKWEYVCINNKKQWFERFKIPDESNAEEAYNYLIKKFEIRDGLNKYEVKSMLSLFDQISKQGYRAYEPINIAYGIKNDTVAKIEERKIDLSGVNVSIEPIRYYPMGTTAAHVLGYLGKISQPNEIEKYIKQKKYSPNQIIGKTGVEESFENKLKGEDGIRKVEVDALGNTIKVLDEKKAIPGNNLYLTIDAKLQKITENSLKKALEAIQRGGTYESKWGNYKFGTNKKKGIPYVNATSGSAVAIDVKTGEVLALANYPAYDPNLFATGISSADWANLFPENEEDILAPRPLYNIALQTAVQPGSTFKMITGLAALEKGLSPNKTIRDMGYIEIGNKRFGCWIWNSYRGTHGRENIYDALRDSCNYYFYCLTLGKNPRTGESLGVKVNIEDIVDMCKKFGLNEKTGIEINIPNESSGIVPNPDKKIQITKIMLKNYLNKNINNYVKQDSKLSNKEIKKIIDEIISWVDMDEVLTRGQVIRNLDKMGIDPEKKINGEREGLADKIKYTYLNQAAWNASDTLNISIGQGQNSYTPIQMANYISTLCNGGYKHKVSVVDQVKNYDNSKVVFKTNKKPEKIKMNDYNHLNDVKIGMRKVASEGTARKLFTNFPVPVAVKTGTAQKSGTNPATGITYDDYAWFVAFGPYEDPQIAVSVVIFQGGSGGYAGPIAREIIGEYLGLNDEEKNEKMSFENELAR